MKRILIPTDFSKNAWNAIDFALQMFAAEDCTFYLLNTFTPAVPTSRFLAHRSEEDSLETSIRGSSEKRLEKTIDKIRSEFGNSRHNFKAISSFNLLADEVSELVKECGIDLVVTGTKGASGMKEVYLGSNTVTIIKNVDDCPVMTIPEGYVFKKPNEIAFATDFNRCFSEVELRPLIALARSADAVIRVVYVQEKLAGLNSWQEFNLNTLRKLFEGLDYFIQTVSEVDSVSNTLELFAREMDVNLLVLLNYHHSYIEKMIREPVVKRTAFHTQIPLLVLPEFDINQMGFSTDQQRVSKG